MAKYIQRVDTNIPHSTKRVQIDLQGKNLILTGGNGCGKTLLLRELHSVLEQKIIHLRNESVAQLEKSINNKQSQLDNEPNTSVMHKYYTKDLELLRSDLDFASKRAIAMEVLDIENYIACFKEKKSLLSFYQATRDVNIKASGSSVSKKSLREWDLKQESQTASVEMFEEYLVSHKTSQAYAESPDIDHDISKADSIKTWFNKLEEDLQNLFEDDKLMLKFNSDELAFFIHQPNKEPYRFQNLSSGFSSILSIYADLLTKVELRDVTPSDLDGVVFIDEIDAHLHVSLQRKIFSFITKAFPSIQFIITTHSPFVVSSVSNAVIYDLSKCEQVDDLSMYSYETILEGLFDTLPISEILKKKILLINEIASSQEPNIKKLRKLVTEVSIHNSKLDDESAFYLQRAELILNKADREKFNV